MTKGISIVGRKINDGVDQDVQCEKCGRYFCEDCGSYGECICNGCKDSK